MGASSKWLKTLIGVKKSSKSSAISRDDLKSSSNEKSKRWGFWRNSIDDYYISEDLDDAAKEDREHALAVAAATAVAAEAAVAAANAAAAVAHLTGGSTSHLPCRASKEDWAALRIQTAFRGFLARRALKALKGLVKLQALFRGHAVRKQAAITLRCMQALVRVQARVRARQVRNSKEGQAVQWRLEQRRRLEAQRRESEQGWCASRRTAEEVQAKLQQKRDAAIRRERALAYAFSHQWRANSRSRSQMYINNEPDKAHWGWSWLERWMAARPWEHRNPELRPKDSSETQSVKSYDNALERWKAESGSQPGSKASERVPHMSTRSLTTGMHKSRSTLGSQDMLHMSSLCCADLRSEGSTSRGTSRSGIAPSRPILASVSKLNPRKMSSPDEVIKKPGYMGTTKSAQARTRSSSTPKQRRAFEIQNKPKRHSLPVPDGRLHGDQSSSKASPDLMKPASHYQVR
ncbi:hypothetical protein O6H91_14G009100 [Diphasiastrum complanatum]|uniref:Uncharacterized protein n=1 Tax=Diphasiastrum complanatum TaxID=34168 RepID=A0ACC2BME2_DIPCM|nr:hypothetical protein O6H91_Y178200 [Diphasiastrum complanatum]KAJ7530582.1 hypothetical protein O6H91_14G009100 [Diphasiastrum complanatum]